MTRRRALVFGLLLALWPAMGEAETDIDPNGWNRVQEARHEVVGPLSIESLVTIARSLEVFRATLDRAQGLPTTGTRTRVLVFDDSRHISLFRPRSGATPGFHLHRSADGGTIVVLAEGSEVRRDVLLHEAAHDRTAGWLPFPLPPWLAEGLAEVESTFRVTGERAEVGRGRADHLRRLGESRRRPLDELLVTSRQRFDGGPADDRVRLYAESWALVDFLVGTPAIGRAGLARLVRSLGDGQGAREALEEVAERTLEELERDLDRWLAARSEAALERGLVVVEAGGGKAGPLSAAEVLWRLGDLSLAGGDEGEEMAERQFRLALEIDPAHAPSWAALALLAQRRGEDPSAAVGRAVEAGSADARVHLLRGRLEMAPLEGRVLPRAGPDAASLERLERAREAFRLSLELDPSSLQARYELARTWLRDRREQMGNGVEALRQLLAQRPQWVDAASCLVSLEARRGEIDRAEEVVRRYLLPSRDRGAVESAWQEILAERLERARGWSDAGRHREAVEALEELLMRPLAEGQDPEVVEPQVRRALATARREHAMAVYRQGVDLANRQSRVQALARFREVLDLTEDPAILALARRRIEELESYFQRRSGRWQEP